jgi:hypothetical protein
VRGRGRKNEPREMARRRTSSGFRARPLGRLATRFGREALGNNTITKFSQCPSQEPSQPKPLGRRDAAPRQRLPSLPIVPKFAPKLPCSTLPSCDLAVWWCARSSAVIIAGFSPRCRSGMMGRRLHVRLARTGDIQRAPARFRRRSRSRSGRRSRCRTERRRGLAPGHQR